LRRGNLEVIDFSKTEIASLRSQRRQKDFFSDLLVNPASHDQHYLQLIVNIDCRTVQKMTRKNQAGMKHVKLVLSKIIG
jgi:hypothetical protein